MPHCLNSSKIQKMQNRYTYHTYTWPLTILAWYRYSNKRFCCLKSPLLAVHFVDVSIRLSN